MMRQLGITIILTVPDDRSLYPLVSTLLRTLATENEALEGPEHLIVSSGAFSAEMTAKNGYTAGKGS